MEALEARLGYTFRDRSLLENALMHSSYANENRARGYTSNERLEFLGDSVLGMVTATRLYRLYPDMPEGKMSRLRAELVCEQALHGVACALGHGRSAAADVSARPFLPTRWRRSSPPCISTAGWSLRSALSSRTSSTVWPRGRSTTSRDYKTELQERVQRRAGQTLSYTVCAESGPDHNKTFTMAVLLNGSEIGRGTGRTKKEAEQSAARCALEQMPQ